ncbi:MAG: MBL fold metallo-hydrolase, partial [Actinobacteria bacterium]|nr:MBL fold metallo-hydrolase [Actinomycetota bacterium]
MEITFYGAAREVTGSCFCIEVNGKKVLIDCGLQQGEDVKDDQGLPFEAQEIECVLLTHAHIDHSGRLPLLVREGFTGKIYTIEATNDLASILLKDSASIQESDAKWENKRRKRAGKSEVKPLYTVSDAEKCLEYFMPCSYGETLEINRGLKVNFVDAGHILGSASLEVFLSEGELSKKIVFSGDIGNTNQPIIRDPQYIDSADYVVMEATYGDRDHEKNDGYESELAGIIDGILSGGGNVIIPSFAVGRTQGILYLLREIKKKGMVSNPDFPVYVDSPLASEATRLYDDDLNIYGDIQTKKIVKEGLNPMSFPNLVFTDSIEDSKALNYDMTPKVIISSSGMCEGGRIGHHLKHNLWRKECAILFVGFQAKGTLGRLILNGAGKVNIFGEEIAVLAKIFNFTGLSAHADRTGLLKWIGNFHNKPDKVFITHVEESVSEKFVQALDESGFKAVAPLYRSSYDLKDGGQISPGIDTWEEVI